MQKEAVLPEPDLPWMMRTYAGHSTARRSKELYRHHLAKGQTGLSIAFDLPTQTGYDADHEVGSGEVGQGGVPVAPKGHYHALLDGLPPASSAATHAFRSSASSRCSGQAWTPPAAPLTGRASDLCWRDAKRPVSAAV